MKAFWPKASEVRLIHADQVLTLDLNLMTVWINFKGANVNIVKKMHQKNHFVITEEYSNLPIELKNLSDDIAPYTSISYNLGKFLGGG